MYSSGVNDKTKDVIARLWANANTAMNNIVARTPQNFTHIINSMSTILDPANNERGHRFQLIEPVSSFGEAPSSMYPYQKAHEALMTEDIKDNMRRELL